MDLDQLRALAAVLEHGSFLAASRALSVSRPTLRARLDALEEELGVSLLVRSHQGVTATEGGERFAERARALLRDAEALVASATEDQEELLGEVRMIAPAGGFPPMLGALLASTVQRTHPEISLHMVSSGDPVSDAGPEVDVALHFGELAQGIPFRTCALARFPVHLLASRLYLDLHGRPERVEDLQDHRLLVLLPPCGDGDRWPLRSGGTLQVASSVRCTDVLMMRTLAAMGQGIALLPDAEVARGAVPGEDFEVVLPDLIGREGVVRVLVAERAHPARTRAIMKLLREIAGGAAGTLMEFTLP